MKTITAKDQQILIDDEDYFKILNYDFAKWQQLNNLKKQPVEPLKWSLNTSHKKRPYVCKKINGKLKMLHRFIYELNNIPIPKGVEIDHINNDVLDNRKENLRLVTRSYNNANARKRSDNTTGYKGVYKLKSDKRIKKYQAYISFNGKRQSLGVYKTAEDAAQAYNEKALELYGEHSLLNT